MMTVPVNGKLTQTDVLVIGGGPAGCCAAIAAARDGAKVILLEAAGCLGGMATAGMVSKWAPFSDKQKVIYSSIPLEILTRYKERAGIPEEKWDWVNIAPETLKLLYDDMMEEAGVKVRFETRVVAVNQKDGVIENVVAADKSGLSPFKAKIYIDCTGDGDVAYFAGAEFEKGDADGTMQPGSLCFMIVNAHLKESTMLSSNPADGLWAKIRDEGKFPLTCKHFIPAYFTKDRSVILANAGHLNGLDSTDPESVSAAYRKGRRIAKEYLDALKYYLPEEFSDAFLAATAPAVGVRESRRILGEYVLTVDDYLARRSFEDEIGRNCYFLDCHGKRAADAPADRAQREKRYAPGESHGIPWRCLIPRGFRNLLVAGRCVSMERMALATIRVMPNCLAMGEAAGHGAAIAAAENLSVKEIPVSRVQAKIKG